MAGRTPISAPTPSPASPTRPPTKSKHRSGRTCSLNPTPRQWISLSTLARNFPPSTLATPLWCSRAHGTAPSQPVTKWCGCLSRTAGPKALTRTSQPDSGSRAASAPRYGDDRRPLARPRTARCTSPMTRRARSGAWPTADARERRRLGNDGAHPIPPELPVAVSNSSLEPAGSECPDLVSRMCEARFSISFGMRRLGTGTIDDGATLHHAPVDLCSDGGQLPGRNHQICCRRVDRWLRDDCRSRSFAGRYRQSNLAALWLAPRAATPLARTPPRPRPRNLLLELHCLPSHFLARRGRRDARGRPSHPHAPGDRGRLHQLHRAGAGLRLRRYDLVVRRPWRGQHEGGRQLSRSLPAQQGPALLHGAVRRQRCVAWYCRRLPWYVGFDMVAVAGS